VKSPRYSQVNNDKIALNYDPVATCFRWYLAIGDQLW
jgi:hypothetical protein